MSCIVLCRKGSAFVYRTSDSQRIGEPFRAATVYDFRRALQEFRDGMHPSDRDLPISERSQRAIEALSWSF